MPYSVGMAKTHRLDKTTFASDGAVRQSGSLPVYVCNDCAAEVVWAESRRTGRKYLVNVRRGYLDQRFYQGNDVHPRDCAERKAEAHAEFVTRTERQEHNRRTAIEQTEIISRFHRDEITRDELLAWIDAHPAIDVETGEPVR